MGGVGTKDDVRLPIPPCTTNRLHSGIPLARGSSQVTFLSLLMATGKLSVPAYSGFNIF